MKIGQMASFIDVDFLPPEYREIYQERLSKLRTTLPRCPGRRCARCSRRSTSERPERVFAEIEEEAFAAASIGQVHRAILRDGTKVAVKIQYPGIADALESDVANAGILVRLAKVLAPGLDAKAVAVGAARARPRGARLRVRGAEPARLRTCLRRAPVHLRPEGPLAALAAAGAGLGLRRGPRLRRGEAARAGRARHLRRDRLPLLLRLDLPPAALQRRHPSRQLPPDGRRAGRLPRLRDDQAPDAGADPARTAGGRRRGTRRPGGAPGRAPRPRLRQRPEEGRRRALDGAREDGRRLVPRGRGGPRSRRSA